MGGPEGQAIPDGFCPNGLLPDETTSVARELDQDRWSRVEERTADLIAHIQPNQPSEERRNAIATYVQCLITKCFSCQVFTFGSVPLKTYLPDGDIDLTAFSNNQNFKDSWAHDVLDILESEERSEDAEFHVKEVQYIQAEVKIIKCLVENIVVDISFNQLGGLCTLCFLDEVDNLISQNHLFKRSIILIKAWCYYESRILGAHHGLISTYALETLVLYIFHVYNTVFSGPLEVLYRFLEFFSKFDWDNYCLSLWGPVPIGSLPDMQVEPPRRDCRELLLNKYFLYACSSVYTAMPSSQESRDQPFVSKYFNIIDPLRANNNLGRSVSKGNFFRIRSAFAFGAQRLVRFLDCPEENLIAEFDLFFRNTWDRHGKGHRPDAPSIDIYARNKEIVENATCHESEVEGAQASHASHGVYWQQVNHSKVQKQMFGTSDVSAVSNTRSHKITGIMSNTMTSDLKRANSMKNTLTDRGQSPKYTSNEVHAMHHFARTQSSPEFTRIPGEVPPQPRQIGTSETQRGKGHSPSSIIDNNKRSSLRSKVSDNHSERVSAKNQQSSWQASSYWRSGDAIDAKDAPNTQDGHFVEKLMQMHQEEQDFINMTATYRNHSFNGYPQAPNSANSTNTPFPVLLPFLASGYTHANSVGMVQNVPFEYFWGHNMPYSQGLGSFPGSQYFPNVRMTSNMEEINETVDENLVVPELDHEDGDADGGFWSEQDVNSVRVHDYEDGSIQAQQRDGKTFASVSSNSVNSSCQTSSGSYSSKDYGESLENGQLIGGNYGDDPPDERILENDVNSTSKSFIPASHATSTTKLSFSSFSNGSTLEDSKLTRDQSGLKTVYPAESSGLDVKKYEGPLDHIILQRDDDGGDWIRQPTVGTDLAEGTSAEVASSDVRTHESTSYGQGAMSVSNSTVPVSPVLVGHGSRQRSIDEQGLLPVIFYPTGPPVPFLTMLPLYNLPAAEGTSYTATNPMDNDAELRSHNGQSNISLDSTENLELSGTLNKPSHTRHGTTLESFDKQKLDILNGDFPSHWQNLQYGRFCQNTELQGLLPYPPSVASPMFVQGQFPWDSTGRPPANMNIMTRVPHFVPMMPIRRGSDGHVGISQHSIDELPRFYGGTGPYLPNPKFIRNRHYSNTRNHRGSYFYDRKDHHGEREGYWNYNPKPRFASRNNFRYQVERSGTRMDRTNSSNRRPGKPSSSYKLGSSNSSMSNNHVTSNVLYGMHPLPVVGASGISPSESAVPSIVMLYPHDQNVNYGSSNWPEFGSLGPVHFSRVNKASHGGESSDNPVNEQVNFEEDSMESSPDDS